MPRQTKNPEERRKDLINAAEELFAERSFIDTTVSDIVKKLGVAQGTFYYYFKSKDEIFTLILEACWEELLQQISGALRQGPVKATDKLKVIFGYLFMPVAGKVGVDKYFREEQESSEVAKFYHRSFDEMRVKVFCSLIQDIVAEGVKAGEFRQLKSPKEITEIIFYGINTYMHIHSPNFMDLSYFNNKIMALEELLEITLGVEAGTFRFTL